MIFLNTCSRKSIAEVTDEYTMTSIKADVHHDVLQEMLNVHCSRKYSGINNKEHQLTYLF